MRCVCTWVGERGVALQTDRNRLDGYAVRWVQCEISM